jgi:signal peptidase I
MAAILRRCADLALTVGALLGLAALMLAALGAASGVRPLLFRSGSMAPTIDTGALALARTVPAVDLRAGDIVSVSTSSGSRVTHRVVDTDVSSGHVVLTLRGDANRVADPERYAVDSAYRVFWHVPWAGYAVAWMVSPAGLFGLGLVLLALLVLATSKATDPQAGGRRVRRKPQGRRARRAGAAAVAAMAVVAGPVGPAAAAPWTDDVGVTADYTAHTVQPPVSTTCSTSSPTATISWPEKDSRDDYEVQLKRADNSVVSTKQVTGAAVSQAYTATGDFGFTILALGTYDFTVQIRSYLAASTTWRSASVLVTTQKIRISIVLVIVPALGSISCV